MTPLPKCGLYAITDATLTPSHTILEQVHSAICGGARIIQFRDKESSRDEKANVASLLLKLCRQASVPLIINDDITLAKDISADGVHLGADDKSIIEARHHLGSQAIIGVSCYNDHQRAVDAQKKGASYVAFGRFYPSATKPLAVQANLEILQTAKQTLRIPVVAIGGITPQNGPVLAKAGADFLAVVAGVFANNNPQFFAQQYAEIYYNLSDCKSMDS